MFENINKFDSERGSKAFSYFSVMSRNYFSQKLKTFKKKMQTDIHISKELISTLESDSNFVFNPRTKKEEEEFLKLLKEEIKTWRSKFTKDQEKIVLDAIILLIYNPDLIDILNKKGIYLYMREITNLSTKQIVNSLVKFKKKYNSFKRKYLNR